MNIYLPYEVLADTEDCLHLKETEVRERMHFVVYRVLPIFLLLFIWFVIQQIGAKIPMGWNYFLIGFAILTTALLFFKSYITEIKIAEDKIFLVQKTVNGSKEISIPLNDVERITFKRRKGKSVGAFFTLHTKNKKSYLLLSIPSFYADEHHIKLVRERLQQMLQTQVV
jgi:energy-coupling factor transporter transmembrane protein EcfT